MTQKNTETVDVNNTLEVINNKETELNKNSIRYTSNFEALTIVGKYEQLFKENGKEYDIKLGVDKSKNPPLYYIIFGENALDIGLKVEQLEKFLTILLDGFQGNPIFGSKELEDYDIPEKSKIGNFIREVSGENFQDPLYNNPKDGTKIEKSQTETNIEKEARKLEIKTEKFGIHETRYRVLYFGENTIFRFPGNFLPGMYVKFNEEKAVSLTKAVIEGKLKIKDIKNSEGLIISEEKSDDPNITDIKTQKQLELERFKVFLKACVDLKEIDSYPISFLPGEGSLGPEVINLNP